MLEKKVKACEDFLSVTMLLKEALENEEMTAVNQLIKRREELIRLIDGLGSRSGRDRQAGLLGKSRRATELVKVLHRVLLRIISANRECDAIAAGRCDGLKKELTILHRKEEGLQGYARGVQRPSRFFDARM